MIVGKDLECGCAGSGGGTGNLTSRGVQTHPGGKSTGPKMSRITGGLDPVAKGFTLRSGSISSGGNRRGSLTGAIAKEGNISQVIGCGDPVLPTIRVDGKTNPSDRAGTTTSIGETCFKIIPSGSTKIELCLFQDIPVTIIDDHLTIHFYPSPVINIFTESDFPVVSVHLSCVDNGEIVQPGWLGVQLSHGGTGWI